MITENLHKNVNLVNESGANVTCAGFNLEIDKNVQVRSTPTRGEWFVTGGAYDSPPSDGILYQLSTSNNHYVGTSVPSDTNSVMTTSADSSVINCSNGVCTALRA